VANYWEGSSIRLRAVEARDGDAHHGFNLTDDCGLLDHIYPPGSLARVEQWANTRSLAGFDGQTYSFQIEALDGGELVGGIAATHCDPRAGIVSHGLHVFAEHRGKAYAREAICLVLRYYFQELRYQKANVPVYDINDASKRLHQKLGFQLEGRIRSSVYTRGEFSDLLWYGITVEEFRTLHPDYWRPPVTPNSAP
jgi:RimJ/RimL family protein N-acetyltransferase